jgi:hypothetical protein
LHENFSRDDEIVGSSDRTFGLTLAGVGSLIGTTKLWYGQESARWWLAAAAILLVAAVIYPPALAPLNRLWLRLGLVLYKVINPIVMGLIFIAGVLPTGLVMRALGRDPLRLKRDAGAASYWIARAPADARSEPMKHQFWGVRSMSFLRELWSYMRVRKKFWLLPMMLMAAIFGGLVVLTQGSVVAPFIYTLF